MRVFGEMAAEGPRPGLPMEQSEDVAGHGIEPGPAGKFALHVRLERVEHLIPRQHRRISTIERPVHLGQKIWIGIGRTAQHHTVRKLEMRLRLS